MALAKTSKSTLHIKIELTLSVKKLESNIKPRIKHIKLPHNPRRSPNR